MLSVMPMNERAEGEEIVALMARLRRGDGSALEPIYRSEAGPVYRYALALCANAAWSADAMQEAFVTLASQPEAFDPLRGSLGAYLAGVARHHLLGRWREARREVEVEPDEDGPAALEGAPEARLIRTQDQAAVWRAIQALPWPFREALVLVDLQERAYVEAARIAGIEINTRRTRLHRARHRLAGLLQSEQPLERGAAS
jgi:RNA polymerase sigma-70 factor (ECF subfamily)